jgi:hypothetical protein
MLFNEPKEAEARCLVLSRLAVLLETFGRLEHFRLRIPDYYLLESLFQQIIVQFILGVNKAARFGIGAVVFFYGSQRGRHDATATNCWLRQF